MNDNPTPPQLKILDQLSGCWGCKDKDSVFVYANADYGKMTGLDHHLDIVGRTDFDMPGPIVECSESFQQQDHLVMTTGDRVRSLEIHPDSTGEWRVHLVTKSPWRNNHNDITGTIFHGIELKDTAILEVGHWICRSTGLDLKSQVSFSLDRHNQPINLNPRESEVLFLLLYGKKPQYIARVLGISVKTVENYVVQLRIKFNANTQNELLDRALDLGYSAKIPASLITQQLSIILKE
ncbi:helix-turn-helix transcriptional regulator [Photobacterium nomapromontoriensis]|uniref:helix-turn-helix transcriptional regulator n=1 Tax=Photobacterium nomapromontoriensis TaxID=2910237 RepID=UPI003D0DFB6C